MSYFSAGVCSSDLNDESFRDGLAPHFEEVSFPVVQVAPWQYMKDSDALIFHYAAEASIDPAGMVLLNYYTSGVFEQFITLFKENMALKEKLADRGGRSEEHTSELQSLMRI